MKARLSTNTTLLFLLTVGFAIFSVLGTASAVGLSPRQWLLFLGLCVPLGVLYKHRTKLTWDVYAAMWVLYAIVDRVASRGRVEDITMLLR